MRPARAGCEPLDPCEAGRARDLATGACVPRRDVRAAAVAAGLARDDGERDDEDRVACDAGEELVATGPLALGTPDANAANGLRLACVARSAPVVAACPLGRVRLGATCVAVRVGGLVDAAAWLAAALGGGACARLARSPLSLSAQPAGAAVAFTVALRIPDNDVTQATYAARWVEPPRGVDASEAAAALDAVIAPRIEVFRALGGTSRSAEADARLRCQLRGVPPKIVVASPLVRNRGDAVRRGGIGRL